MKGVWTEVENQGRKTKDAQVSEDKEEADPENIVDSGVQPTAEPQP